MLRRRVLSSSLAMLSVNLTMSRSQSMASANSDRPRKIAQIGTAHAHASGKMSAMRALPELWEVLGVSETDPELRRLAEKSSAYAELPFLSEAEILNQSDLTTVVVETRIEDSCTTALNCLRAGKNVHLDKPGALDHADFKAMRLEAERLGLVVQMGYMLRYNPAFELLFQSVKEGWLGEITEIDAAMGKLADPGTRKTLAALEGGGMFELACHVIDAAVTILGKPREVRAFSTPVGDDGTKDNQTAVLVYPHATAVIRCNHADPFGGPRRRFNVTGTEGTLEIVPLESGRINLSLSKARGNYRKGHQSIEIEIPKGRYDREFVDLAEVVAGKKPLAWDAVHDIAVHETVLRAAGVWRE
ncbi:MAG TPA: gfo/Idh/MocA family oxidoreductase [Verrucomicrobiales bacterium]|nr:gfo/Idh/MocA family oxidoreductase [Verrucomicrobiales bacterium]